MTRLTGADIEAALVAAGIPHGTALWDVDWDAVAVELGTAEDDLPSLVEKVERLIDPPIPDGYEWASGNNWRDGWDAAIEGVVLLIRNAR